MTAPEGFSFRFGSKTGDRVNVLIAGLDTGPHAVVQVASRGAYRVWKFPGFTGWSGVGMTEYYPTEYKLVKVKVAESEGTDLTSPHSGWFQVVKVLDAAEPGHSWRSELKRLIELADLYATAGDQPVPALMVTSEYIDHPFNVEHPDHSVPAIRVKAGKKTVATCVWKRFQSGPDGEGWLIQRLDRETFAGFTVHEVMIHVLKSEGYI